MCDDDSEKAWYLQMMAKYKYHISRSDANTLQISAFKKNNQLLKPISGIVYSKIRFAIDDTRARNIKVFISRFADYSELSLEIEEVLSNLSFGIAAEKFESAMCSLGRLLGYISQRPDKEIRKGPDAFHLCNELLAGVAALHSLTDRGFQLVFPFRNMERICFRFRDGQSILAAEFIVELLDHPHLFC